MNRFKIGLIRERKASPDARVPFTPKQCLFLIKNNIEVAVEPSPLRCFADAEYQELGVPLAHDLSDCDILMGIKEVPIDYLVPNKTYFFFSHTIRKQTHNRKIIQTALLKNIKLIDYEVLTNHKNERLIAFGRFAGMVGAHNGVMLYGQRTGLFALPRMKDLHDYAAAKEVYKATKFQKMRVVLTGHGRVGAGAAQVLEDMNLRRLSPQAFLSYEGDEAVFTQLSSADYTKRKHDGGYDKTEFYADPTHYESNFMPFATKADVMVNGIYWDTRSPAFFTQEEMASECFNIKTIADVTCDIAPESSIPSTLFASTIAEPAFGYNPKTNKIVAPFAEGVIDMMTIDNLPSELPRDASDAFGQQFIDNILEDLLNPKPDGVLERGTIVANGRLMPNFSYLTDYAAGRE